MLVEIAVDISVGEMLLFAVGAFVGLGETSNGHKTFDDDSRKHRASREQLCKHG